MTKVIQCPCGYSIRDEDENGLVRSAQAHAMTAHGLELTREQAMAMAKPEHVGRRATHGKGTQV
jgi:predicted small metal-binding protein